MVSGKTPFIIWQLKIENRCLLIFKLVFKVGNFGPFCIRPLSYSSILSSFVHCFCTLKRFLPSCISNQISFFVQSFQKETKPRSTKQELSFHPLVEIVVRDKLVTLLKGFSVQQQGVRYWTGGKLFQNPFLHHRIRQGNDCSNKFVSQPEFYAIFHCPECFRLI